MLSFGMAKMHYYTHYYSSIKNSVIISKKCGQKNYRVQLQLAQSKRIQLQLDYSKSVLSSFITSANL